MDYEFNEVEIKDAARAARIYCHGFNEEKFESLMELEKRVGDQAYLQTVLGMIRLEDEKGVSCVEALDACEKLIEQKAKLEKLVPDLEKRAATLITQIRKAAAEYKQLEEAKAKAEQDLKNITNEYAKAERKLEIINKKAEQEKQRIADEVDECYRSANVTKEEVVTAGHIKEEVEKHGFELATVLDLCKEFAGHPNAREMLVEGFKKHDSFIKYLDGLHDSAEKEKAKVTADITGIVQHKNELILESSRLERLISQLQANVAYEDELRLFHRRYFALSGLMTELTTWEQVYFMRCGNPFNVAAGVFDKKQGSAHFWMDRPPVMCPHCSSQKLFFDTEIYQYLNWPAEVPLKLTLGK